MLLDLRETVRNSKPIKYTLITIICIPFVLFGIGSYFSAGGPGNVAEVDGQEISAQAFENAYGQQRRQLAQMFGGSIPEGFGDEQALRQQALDGLVRQQIVRNLAIENGFTVSDKSLASAIQELGVFQDAEGRFDKERYVSQLRASGTTVEAFEYSYREDAAVAQVQSGIVQTAFTLPSERDQLDELTRQLRHVDVLRFPIDQVREGIEVTDDEAQSFYDENKENYKFPERVKIKYVRLSAEALANEIDVTDEEALAYFEANKGNYVTAEERKASHILLNLAEDASDAEVEEKTALLTSLRERISAGESFADLAKEFSEDPGSAANGGSLGQIAPGVMVPAFETAVFALENAGDISEPVRTEYGVHLILVDEILAEKGETFEQAKPRVISAITRSQAQTEFLNLQEVLEREAFDNPESLQAVADSTGLEIVETDWIDGGDETPFELSDPRILQTALSEDVKDNGNNSDPIQLGDNDLLVLRTEAYEDQRQKTLDDVRDDIVAEVTDSKAGDLLESSMKEARELFEQGSKGLSDIAEQTGGTLEADVALGRRSTDFDPAVVRELFELPKPSAEEPVIHEATLANGDRVLMAFNRTSTEESAQESASSAESASLANPIKGSAEFSAVLEAIQSGVNIKVNESVLSGENQYYGGGGY